MRDFIMHYIHNIPWPFLMVKGLSSDKIRVQKVWEGIIIALLTAAITAGANSYIMIQIIDAKLSFLQQQVRDNHADIRDMRNTHKDK